MSLDALRKEIDEIDSKLVKLFEERMNTAKKIAAVKKGEKLRLSHKQREREIINRLSAEVSPDLSVYTKILYNTLFDLSKSYQSRELYETSEMGTEIADALNNTPRMLPSSATVACQGIEGAYSQQACEKLFSNPSIAYFNNFRGVFDAVKSGMCKYGILPVENSVHGSVTQVIDLMKEYDFYIVKSVKTQINHTLLAKPGTKEITEIYSHSQALGQCDKYLKSLKGVKITAVENTAEAAKMVADSKRNDIAAVSSPVCADIYGLEIVNDNIVNSENNYTRFICISKNMEIYPGADKISFLVNLSHEPGSLYTLISKFAAVGINLTKIESRPIPGRDFEFMFYFEMSVSVYSEDFITLINELEAGGKTFKFLGSYLES